MSSRKNIILVADSFPPERISAAKQLGDLSQALVHENVSVNVIVPSSRIDLPYKVAKIGDVNVIFVRSQEFKNKPYAFRLLVEITLPLIMFFRLSKYNLWPHQCDLLVWYSPSIFFGLLVKLIKRKYSCRGYLILRDMFPDWSYDLGLINYPTFLFLRIFAIFQYRQADFIGIQSPSNIEFLPQKYMKPGVKIEILHNWYEPNVNSQTSIVLNDTCLKGRKVFVYAGNMGVAQNIDLLVEAAILAQDRMDVGFLFVGRGSELLRVKRRVHDSGANNILILDEIESDEIDALYSKCHVGMVSLNPKHKTHNIPGKFISYVANGMPVLASVNADNDLIQIIRDNSIGVVCQENDPAKLVEAFDEALEILRTDKDIEAKATKLSLKLFRSSACAKQLLEHI